MIDLKHKLVWVTGANSMIGRATINALLSRGADVVSASHKQCDLMDINNIRRSFYDQPIDYCISLAGYNGNIDFNRKFPADIFYRTTQINLNTLKFCQEHKVKKVVSIISSCSYADNGEDYLHEDQFWRGLPNKSVECHGLSKRTSVAYGRQLATQYNILPISVILNNSYGPYDSFDEKKTKVIGGLINRFSRAKEDDLPSVSCWGSGAARRSFVYCDDAGEGLVRSLERYDDPMMPINIGMPTDITIKRLSELIAELVGYSGKIEWDGRNDGQLIKTLDTERMKSHLNWEPATSLEEGLRKTIDWYNSTLKG